MKYSLAEIIGETHSRRVDSFFSICFSLCNFLEEQHNSGVVLKNFCPDLIFIDFQNNKAQLCSRPLEKDEILPYISPEQTGRINRQVDYRSDFYSLGAIFYQLLTGELPFHAVDLLGWYYAHVSIEPKPPCTINPEIPLALSDLVLKLMAKSPDDRYQSIKGLKADLKMCYHAWQITGSKASFSLGQADLSKILRLQDQFFDREEENAILMEALRRASQGSTEVVLISGYPGVGKSCLVREFSRRVSCPFVRGTYNQFRDNIPYMGIAQAMRDLVKQLLTKSSEEIKFWGERFQKALGTGGGIIGEIIPEFKLIAGELPPLQNLPPREAENRFLTAIKSFFQVFSQQEEPLIVFLDDLQWLDSTSLKLIEALLTADLDNGLLFIGAYRVNEMPEKHLEALQEIIANNQLGLHEIPLEAFDFSETQKLVAGILRYKGEDRLARSIFRKSAGNPLYIKQIIYNLYEEGHLFFSADELCWRVKEGVLDEIDVNESIVEYVAGRLKKLPGETIELLKFASCLGKRFCADTIAHALNQPLAWVENVLQPALNLDIIVKEESHNPSGISRFFEHEHEEAPVAYEFLHDRLREAAYSLMSDQEKKLAHYRAGRIIYKKAGALSREELFGMVAHLNYSADLLTDEKERIELAEYNLAAAEKAKLSNAHTSALKYLKAGISLLPKDSWKRFYRLTFDLYKEYYWCMFTCSGFFAAEPIFQLIMEKVRHNSDKVEISFRKTILCTGYYKPEEAISAGLAALEYLGVHLPLHPSTSAILNEILFIRLQLFGKKIESLLHLPQMQDEKAKQIMHLLANLTPPTSLINPKLFMYILLKMTSISLKFGNTDYSPFAYSCYGIILSSRFFDFKRTASLQEVALKLVEKYDNYPMKTKVYYTIATYLNHWSEHLRKNLEYGKKAEAFARETGDWMMLGITLTEMVQLKCMMGESIEEIQRCCRAALDRIKYGMPDSKNLLKAIGQFLKNLSGKTADPFSFSSEDYDENAAVKKMISTKKGFIINHYYLMKMEALYLHNGHREAFAIAQKLKGQLDTILGKMLHAEIVYWSCLAAAAAYKQSDKKERRDAKRLLNKNLRLLRKWSRAGADNFLHKYCLAAAERNRLRGDFPKAMSLYKKAIDCARKNGFTLDLAVAYELAARFYLDLGFEENGQSHLVSAHQTYLRFGAAVKAKLLQKEFPQWLSKAKQAVLLEGAQSFLASAIEEAPDFEAANEISQDLDFLTLQKAIESLSDSKDKEGFAKKLFEIIITSSGAQRAYLFSVRDKEITSIIAGREPGEELIFSQERISEKDLKLSWVAISYVLNAGEAVSLDDAGIDSVFNKDPYITDHNVKSLLCLPLFAEKNLVGLLYLENNSATRVFSVNRSAIFAKLALQIINTENLQGGSGSKPKHKQTASLTEKERKILGLMTEGLSNAEIAKRMHVSEGTVKWHTNNIFKKLGVENRTQAVIKMTEMGDL